MRRLLLLLALVAGVPRAEAQDALTIGSGSAAAGNVASIPVSIRDASGTALGSDAGSGNRIQGFAFKVMFSTDVIASVSFARAGVTASLTPLYETALQGDGWSAYVVSFSESSNAIPFTLNALAPGDTIGTLMVTLKAAASVGSSAALRLDPPSAILSNQAGSVRETVALGNLALVNGSVTVTLPAPTNLVATAVSTSQVNITWDPVANADHYEVWRSVDGGAFVLASSPDTSVVAGKTYLYRVRAVDAMGCTSSFSNLDPATTIAFTDDPLDAQLIKAVHLTEVRDAVNAYRVSAGLGPLASDPTLAAGQLVRASHITALRTALDEARTAIGVPALIHTDPTLTPNVTTIKSAHVSELRDGVR